MQDSVSRSHLGDTADPTNAGNPNDERSCTIVSQGDYAALAWKNGSCEDPGVGWALIFAPAPPAWRFLQAQSAKIAHFYAAA